MNVTVCFVHKTFTEISHIVYHNSLVHDKLFTLKGANLGEEQGWFHWRSVYLGLTVL